MVSTIAWATPKMAVEGGLGRVEEIVKACMPSTTITITITITTPPPKQTKIKQKINKKKRTLTG